VHSAETWAHKWADYLAEHSAVLRAATTAEYSAAPWGEKMVATRAVQMAEK
jgi:hypothetical protein